MLVAGSVQGATQGPAPGAAIAKRVVDVNLQDGDLLRPKGWKGWHQGFEQQGAVFLCDNGPDSQVERGVSQTVSLNQKVSRPIVATAWSKAEGVGGSRNSDYSLYLDLTYEDGTPLWGQTYAFHVGTHDWQKAQVVVFPDKPVRAVHFHLLLRRHSGKAWFRDPQLHVMEAALFDGVPIRPTRGTVEGFQVRDVAAGGDFVRIAQRALGLDLQCRQDKTADATFSDVTCSVAAREDRAITLLYVIPIDANTCRWLHDPRRSMDTEAGREYLNASPCGAGATGRLSRYPFAAVAAKGQGVGLGIDMTWCDGAVWSINSMPGVRGDVTDFKNKWNKELRDALYGPQRKGDLDGEYVDSSEGYVTDELDFRREHFAACETPSDVLTRPSQTRHLQGPDHIRIHSGPGQGHPRHGPADDGQCHAGSTLLAGSDPGCHGD